AEEVMAEVGQGDRQGVLVGGGVGVGHREHVEARGDAAEGRALRAQAGGAQGQAGRGGGGGQGRRDAAEPGGGAHQDRGARGGGEVDRRGRRADPALGAGDEQRAHGGQALPGAVAASVTPCSFRTSLTTCSPARAKAAAPGPGGTGAPGRSGQSRKAGSYGTG